MLAGAESDASAGTIILDCMVQDLFSNRHVAASDGHGNRIDYCAFPGVDDIIWDVVQGECRGPGGETLREGFLTRRSEHVS